MYGNYMGDPFMMPNMSYGPMLNSTMAMNSIPSTMARGSSLGSGLRSLLGLGGTRNLAGGVSRGINWSSLLNNTSKTLGVVREAIPIVKEVGPMMNNMKSMLKVASVFKDATDVNSENTSNDRSNNIKSTTDNFNNQSSTKTNITQNEPNFFL